MQQLEEANAWIRRKDEEFKQFCDAFAQSSGGQEAISLLQSRIQQLEESLSEKSRVATVGIVDNTSLGLRLTRVDVYEWCA